MRTNSKRLAKGIALVAMIGGSLLLSPAAAHLNSPLTFKHLKKHFYTKIQSNQRFVNVDEPAMAAVNAEKLDNLDSTAFQRDCSDGAVIGAAQIDGGTVSDIALNTQGLFEAFSCAGTVTVRANNMGDFEVHFGHVDGPLINCGDGSFLATVQDPDVGYATTDNTSEGTKCTVRVRTYDAMNNAADLDFYVAVLRGPTDTTLLSP